MENRKINCLSVQTTTIQTAFALLTLLCLLALLSACGGSSGESVVSEVAAKSPVDTEQTVLQALYRDQRTPEGFYQALPSDSGYYSVTHIKNTDILPLAQRTGQPVYELSTNDFTEALAWSEQQAVNTNRYRDLVDTTETDLFFQFSRVDMDEPDVTYYSRVLKRSAIDRDQVDLKAANDDVPWYVGKIAPENINAGHMRLILEYLWAFTGSNNFGYAVTDTRLLEQSSRIVYELEEARLTLDYSADCDRVAVYRIQYSLNKLTGDISKQATLDRSFLASQIDGQYLICE